MPAALFLIGAPGSGKSAVLEELATRLERAGTAHGALESEELGRGFPPLASSAWTRGLAATLAIQRDAGRRLFLIAATPESSGELGDLLAAAACERQLVVCLRARAETLVERLQGREPDSWPGKAGLIERARSLADLVPRLAAVELVVDADRCPPASAAELIHTQMQRRGLTEQPPPAAAGPAIAAS
jgi:hypothetical protein